MTTRRPLTDSELADVLASVGRGATLPASVAEGVKEATLTTEQRRRGRIPWLRFPGSRGALRLAASAVGLLVIAAFGGLLMLGLVDDEDDELAPATSPSPMATVTPEIIDGLTVESIRPGIVRVLDDGYGHPTGDARHVEVGPHGTVWVAANDGTVFRLGAPGSFDPEDDGYPTDVQGFHVLGDGTLAAYDDRWLSTTVDHGPPDGQEWIGGSGLERVNVSRISDLVQADDGALWVASTAHDGRDVYQLARLADDGDTYYTWDDLGLHVDGEPIHRVARTPDGSIWASRGSYAPSDIGLVRLVGDQWRREDPFGDGLPYLVRDMTVDRDGVLWAALVPDEARDGAWTFIGRWDGAGWIVEPVDGRRSLGAVGPDGTRWSLGGLESIEGTIVTDYEFPGPYSATEVRDVAFAPDGHLWVVLADANVTPVLPGGPEPGLYMVEPEAAAQSTPVRREPVEEPLAIPIPEFGDDVVVNVYAVGDTWYAEIDSIGPVGDRALGVDQGAENPVGSADDPRAAIEAALRPLGEGLAREAAEAAELGEWEE